MKKVTLEEGSFYVQYLKNCAAMCFIISFSCQFKIRHFEKFRVDLKKYNILNVIYKK